MELLHKPGVQVRILGGSLEQSGRMWEHLEPDLEKLIGEQIDRDLSTAKSVTLKNGSKVGVLAQSQKAVRGLRVQKLRCDEVEMFDPKVWEAGQLTTRSLVRRDVEHASCDETARGDAARIPLRLPLRGKSGNREGDDRGTFDVS